MKALSGIYKVGINSRIVGDLVPSDTLTVRVADDRVDKLPRVDFFLYKSVSSKKIEKSVF